jgi:hypothetical protein
MRLPLPGRMIPYRLISLTVLSCYLAGCSFFGSKMQTIGVSSDPPGAEVTASGKPVGTTPVHFQAQRGETLLVEVKKSGYQTQYRSGFRTLSTLGILDVVGGSAFLLPLLGLLSSGAWTHDPDEYGFILEPHKETSQIR